MSTLTDLSTSTTRPRWFSLLELAGSFLLIVGLIQPPSLTDNLVADPSFEKPKEKDRFGRVFSAWGGWIYDGVCEFRVSNLAHTGKHSLLIVGKSDPKIRIWPEKLTLVPGRYRVSAFLRGVDIGTGKYGETTEFMFDGNYMPLKKNGTFGWTRFTFVGEIKERRVDKAMPSFGLLAPGYLWIDDVSVVKVEDDVPLTPTPLFGKEEKPIEPPGPLTGECVNCPECGNKNPLASKRCFACDTPLENKPRVEGPDRKLITSFEDRNPFSGGTVVDSHATDGTRALRLDRGYASLDTAQNWTGYDFLEVDVYTPSRRPVPLTIEVRDRQTGDYWTRVNYTTIVPPGASTLLVPTALYVGEKSRPGRALQLDAITRLVFALDDGVTGPLFLDNIRLRRDTEPQRVRFQGLWAFDVGPAGSPLMEGFQPLDPSRHYTAGRGYGWKNVRIWRGHDALQPEPLYQDFLCIEQGGLALDVPNGKYHVFVNMDSPSGYWGEVQRYRRRALIVEGVRLEDTMDRASFRQRYFRSFSYEDLPADNTFDRYQIPYFQEKQLVAEVRDGQLNIDFEGENWACCVSAIIVYPAEKDAEGKRFLEFVKQRRRFHFDNAFKRIIHQPEGDKPQPTSTEKERGYIAFTRDWMQDVFSTDTPTADERVSDLRCSAFAGEYEPLTVSLYPLRDLGRVTASVSDLRASSGVAIPSSIWAIHHVQNRITRVTAEGSVYTLSPRRLIPGPTAPIPSGLTRTFWLTARVPEKASPGLYEGTLTLTPEKGAALTLPLRLTVRKGTLDPVDIPAGPWGHTIDLPWYPEESATWNQTMARKSLRKMREYGFTTASGLPLLTYQGFKDGRPQIDFSRGDAQMRLFREEGFRQPVVTYCPLVGLDLYKQDLDAMRAAGFTDYSAFIRAIFGSIQRHADRADWLPVYWNIGDEPLGDDLVRGAENAEAYRKAFPKGPPYFTAATSFRGNKRDDPHFRFSRALSVANWNDHDAAGVKLLQDAGGDWAFYNGGNRWSYGFYLYKVAKQHRMKFRLSWHWNVVAGDPNYALDCREDDYAWCYAGPEGELIPVVHFERLREGLDDYRRLLTLARLSEEKDSAPGRAVLAEILSSFRLGDREQADLSVYLRLRRKLDEAIENLR